MTRRRVLLAVSAGSVVLAVGFMGTISRPPVGELPSPSPGGLTQAPPTSTSEPPAIGGLPTELAGQAWVAHDPAKNGTSVGTLDGSFVALPNGERLLDVGFGHVVSVDLSGFDDRPGHLFVRDLATGGVIAQADVPIIIAGAALGPGAAYVSGGRPMPGGGPGEVLREIYGIWRLGFDGTLTLLEEPRPAPAEWADLTISRALLPNQSGEVLGAAICRFPSGAIGGELCDVEVVQLPEGAVATPIRDLQALPVLLGDGLVVGYRADPSGDVQIAVSLSDGSELWRERFPNVRAAYIDELGKRFVQTYLPFGHPGSQALSTLDLVSGSRSDLLTWQTSDRGSLNSYLSLGRYAVLAPELQATDVVGSGSSFSILDLDTIQFLPGAFSIR